MAINYGGVAKDVQDRLPYRKITDDSTPSTGTVLKWIEEGEAMIDNSLRSNAIVVPVTDARGVVHLRSLSIDYAEAHTRMAYAASGGDGDNDDGLELLETFQNTLIDMENDPVSWAAKLTGGSGAEGATNRRLRGTPTDDVDGRATDSAAFAPVFNKADLENQF